MRAVIQRVSASVTVDGQVVGAIGHGFLVLLGITTVMAKPRLFSWRARLPDCAFSRMPVVK